MSEEHNQSTRQRWIPGYEGLYMATYFGEIISMPRLVRNGRGIRLVHRTILKATKNKFGYLRVGLHKNNIKCLMQVHSIIALAFLGKRPNGLVINHIDAIILNNCANNLEYISHCENIRLGWDKKITSSKYRGVCFDKVRKNNPWRSYIYVDGKHHHLGVFATEDKAYQKRQETENSEKKGAV